MYEIWSVGHKPFENLTNNKVSYYKYDSAGPAQPVRANFFFGRGFNLEIFLNLQGSEFIQTLLFIYNHLAKFVVYKSWTRSVLLKGTSKCFLVSSIACRSKEAIEWVWSFLCGKIEHKTTPITSSSLSQAMTLGRKNLLVA